MDFVGTLFLSQASVVQRLTTNSAQWSRLVGGAGTSPKKQSNPNTPQHRLAYFKRIYIQLLHIWRNGDGVSEDAFVAENVRIYIRRLAELLNDDTRGPTPHLCISFAATSSFLATVAKIASAFHDDGIVHEALEICGLLIDSEEEAFLEDRGFAKELPTFFESVKNASPRTPGLDTDSAILEVLFNIASRIRLQPGLLPVWFRPWIRDEEAPERQNRSSEESNDITRSDEFPLFYLLLQYVPSEGRAGEFARMGLLYVIEASSHSESLEKWIVDGDMAALMASGLGALYSQLSRKLALSYEKDETPAIFAFSNTSRIGVESDVTETTSPDYQTHLKTFLAYLVFWQDILEHCSSVDVKGTLLEHFKFLFLQQLLYPSLLESSDTDGGSSVAVLTYLRHILETTNHPDIARVTLQYLLGLPEPTIDLALSTRPTALARRRKSERLVTRMADGGNDASPDLFNLADLILTSLGSRSQQTINATLQLLSVMLHKQHVSVLYALLKTRPVVDVHEKRSIDVQEREMDILFSMVENRLIPSDELEASYEQYLQDCRSLIENHLCSMHLFAIPEPSLEIQSSRSSDTKMKPLTVHTLLLEDPILRCLLKLLDCFFCNDIETNLCLTQVVIDLASCGYMRLGGWLLTDPSEYTIAANRQKIEEAIEDSVATLIPRVSESSAAEEPRPNSAQATPLGAPPDLESISPIFAALERLAQQVDHFRTTIPDFETHLRDCHTMIHSSDTPSPTPPSAPTPTRHSFDSTRTSPSRPKLTANNTPIPARIRQVPLPHGPPTPSVSGASSPRGRQPNPSATSSTPTLVGRLSHLRVSPARTPSQSTARTYSPSPLGKASIAGSQMSTSFKARPAAHTAESEAMWRKVKVGPAPSTLHIAGPDVTPGNGSSMDVPGPTSHEVSGSETSSLRSESMRPEGEEEGLEMSLGQVLTNVVILGEFVLELAAMVEVRGGLLGDVRI